MIRTVILSAVLLLCSITNILAQGHSGHVIAKEGAWCWFADPRALHYENKEGTIDATYIGYIDNHGSIKATQINWLTNETEEVLVRSWFQPDDHDNPSFIVLPDERVMIIYSRHTDEACFYYRISTRPGDITSLGEEKRLATDHNTTYPNPFILSDDPEHIYMCWRGINWHPTVARLTMPDKDDNMHFDWGPYQMVQSSGARPYAKYISNGKDKIGIAYTTGHPDNETPNWLYYNVFDINSKTLTDVTGTEISTIGKGETARIAKSEEYFLANPYAVVDHPNKKRDWLWNIAFDKKSNPIIGMTRISEDKKKHDYYYAKWTGKTWQKTFIAHGGGHFHQSPTTENCYSGGMAIDRDNPRQVYCSVPLQGTYEIVKFTMTDDGSEVFAMDPLTYDSKKNNVRPFCIEGTQKSGTSYMTTEKGDKVSHHSPLHVLWMNGDYYYWLVNTRYPEGYPTSIRGNIGVPSSKKRGKNFFQQTISLKFKDDAYGGAVFSWGNIRYSIGRTTLYPILTINDKAYKSQNIFATADSWATLNRATTDGKWYTPYLYKECTLRITHDGKFLTIYRDGIIDQRIECAQPKGSFIKLQ